MGVHQSAAVYAACDLRIAEVLAKNGPMTKVNTCVTFATCLLFIRFFPLQLIHISYLFLQEELAHAVNADPERLERLMSLLISLSVFSMVRTLPQFALIAY